MSLTVAIASTQKGWRGGEEQARLLAEGLREKGDRVIILARRATPFAQRMTDAGFLVHAFSGRGWNPAASIGIRRFLRRQAPDVIHLNDSHSITAVGLAGLGIRTPLRIASRRVAFPIHSRWRYQTFCDGLICISEAVANIARQAGLDERVLHIVHDGVDPGRMDMGDRTRGRKSLDCGDRPVLLFVAALTEEKGHHFLLDAMSSFITRHPDALLVLAGDGPCRQSISKRMEKLGLQDHVLLLGHREDIADLMCAADLFVFPSENEGLGSSVIDAMLCGLPVVCADSGGTGELLAHPQRALGWLVPPGDAVRLSSAMDAAMSSAHDRATRAHMARAHAQEHFVSTVMVNRTRQLYEQLLQRSGRRAA